MTLRLDTCRFGREWEHSEDRDAPLCVSWPVPVTTLHTRRTLDSTNHPIGETRPARFGVSARTRVYSSFLSVAIPLLK